MLRKLFLATVAFSSVLSMQAFGQTGPDHRDWTGREYFLEIGQNVSVKFQQTETDITAFELEAVLIDYQEERYYSLGVIPSVDISIGGGWYQTPIQFPRAGHFFLRLRAIRNEFKSEWCYTIDPACAAFDGTPGAWRVFVALPPPPGGGIEEISLGGGLG